MTTVPRASVTRYTTDDEHLHHTRQGCFYDWTTDVLAGDQPTGDTE